MPPLHAWESNWLEKLHWIVNNCSWVVSVCFCSFLMGLINGFIIFLHGLFMHHKSN